MLSTVCPSEGGINVVKLIPSSFDFVFFLGKWEPRLYCKKSSQEPITSKSLRSRAPSPPPREGGLGALGGRVVPLGWEGGGLSGFQMTGMIKRAQKSKPRENPWARY